MWSTRVVGWLMVAIDVLIAGLSSSTVATAAWTTNFLGTRSNFAVHGAARVAFDVVHQDVCADSHSEVCVAFTWSCYEANELHNQLADRRAGPRTPRWYFLDVEGERETLRFEMRKATTMTPTARLTPYRNYSARVYSIYQEHVMLIRNFTFETIRAAPSQVQQLTVDVLDRNVAYLPRARKLNISWHAPQDFGARTLSGYMVGLYKKPEFNFRAANYKNITIMEVETNNTWHIVEPVSFYEKKLFVKVVPYNLLYNGSHAYGREMAVDVYLRSQYGRELIVNSVGGQSVDIEIDQDIFRDVIEAGLVTNISVYVSPVEMHNPLSWKATDFSRAVVEDKLKRKQIRAVFRVSPLGWNLANCMDKRRADYARFPCFEGGDRKKVVCSVGVDERCDRLMYSQICNAPLVKDMNYTVFIRAHLKKSNYLPEYDDSKPLPVSLHSVSGRWTSTEQLFPLGGGRYHHSSSGYRPHMGNYDPRFGHGGRPPFDMAMAGGGASSGSDILNRYDSTRGYGADGRGYDQSNPNSSPGRFDHRTIVDSNDRQYSFLDPASASRNRDWSLPSGTQTSNTGGSGSRSRFDPTSRYGIGERDVRREDYEDGNEGDIYETPYGPVQHIPEQP